MFLARNPLLHTMFLLAPLHTKYLGTQIPLVMAVAALSQTDDEAIREIGMRSR